MVRMRITPGARDRVPSFRSPKLKLEPWPRAEKSVVPSLSDRRSPPQNFELLRVFDQTHLAEQILFPDIVVMPRYLRKMLPRRLLTLFKGFGVIQVFHGKDPLGDIAAISASRPAMAWNSRLRSSAASGIRLGSFRRPSIHWAAS